jgi:hypothetical protein
VRQLANEHGESLLLALRGAANELALLLWVRTERTVGLDELPGELFAAVNAEGHHPLDTEVIRWPSVQPMTFSSGSDDGTPRCWDVATGACLAIFLGASDGWVAFRPDGRYKLGGNLGGAFWHTIGLCRFEPGELDPYLPPLRIPDDEPLLPARR